MKINVKSVLKRMIRIQKKICGKLKVKSATIKRQAEKSVGDYIHTQVHASLHKRKKNKIAG